MVGHGDAASSVAPSGDEAAGCSVGIGAPDRNHGFEVMAAAVSAIQFAVGSCEADDQSAQWIVKPDHGREVRLTDAPGLLHSVVHGFASLLAVWRRAGSWCALAALLGVPLKDLTSVPGAGTCLEVDGKRRPSSLRPPSTSSSAEGMHGSCIIVPRTSMPNARTDAEQVF